MYPVVWESIHPKSKGGLGMRRSQDVNTVLLAKL